MSGHSISNGRSSACRSLVLDLKMSLTRTGLNDANVLPFRVSLFLLNGFLSTEYFANDKFFIVLISCVDFHTIVGNHPSCHAN